MGAAPSADLSRVAMFTGLVFGLMTLGVGLGLIEPTFTSDVICNLLFGIPVILLPLVLLWDAPGEQRSRLDKAAELTLFYLPYTAFSQIGYELMFLIGSPLGWWGPTSDPGFKWLWWQYGLADTRYTSGNPWTFALEIVGVTTGVIVIIMWTRLIRPDLPAESRIRCLWVAFTGIAVLMSSTAVYFLSEVGAGFNDIGQGAYGLGFKFFAETSRSSCCRRSSSTRSICRSTTSPDEPRLRLRWWREPSSRGRHQRSLKAGRVNARAA